MGIQVIKLFHWKEQSKMDAHHVVVTIVEGICLVNSREVVGKRENM